jgi:hypothetical protein
MLEDAGGGGVYAGGSGNAFAMSGGVISGNYVSGYGGGGVCVDSGFTMTGGSITGNTVSAESPAVTGGGGVWVRNGFFAFNPESGALISGNTAAGMDILGGVLVANYGTLTVNGGKYAAGTVTNTAFPDYTPVKVYAYDYSDTDSSVAEGVIKEDGSWEMIVPQNYGAYFAVGLEKNGTSVLDARSYWSLSNAGRTDINLTVTGYLISKPTVIYGGSISVPERALPGMVITPEANPDSGYQIIEGTYRYYDTTTESYIPVEGSFSMPAGDIYVSVQFELMVPANVTAAGGTRQISVSWDAVESAVRYEVFFSDTDGSDIENFSVPHREGRITEVFTGNNFTPNKNLLVYISAVNADWRSSARSEAAAARIFNNNANLEILEVTGYAITPELNAGDTTAYSLIPALPYSVREVNLRLKPEDANASVASIGASSSSVETSGLTGGVTEARISLPAENRGELIQITVRAEDGALKTYALTLSSKGSTEVTIIPPRFGDIAIPLITRTNGDGSITLAVEEPGYTGFQWYVDNLPVGTESAVTIKGYAPGIHRVGIIVYKNGIPYSAESPFTVE